MPSTSTYIPGKVYKQQLIFDAFQSISGVSVVWSMMRMGSLLAPVSGGLTYYLTEQGTVTYGRTSQGGPYVTTGATSYVYAADAAWNSPTTAFTLACYVQFAAAATAVEAIAGKWLSAGDQRSWYVQRDASGNTLFYISPDGTLASQVAVGLTASPITTAWTFIAARFTASSEMKLWVNAITNNKTSGVPATIYDGTGNIQIGSINSLTSPMSGNVGVIGFYSTALADATITALYNATKGFYGL